MANAQAAFHTAQLQTKISQCERLVPFHEPAPATYTRPCPMCCQDWSNVLDQHLRWRVFQRCRLPLRRTDFGQTKVQNLCVASIGDEQVRRLNVPVDDAFRV